MDHVPSFLTRVVDIYTPFDLYTLPSFQQGQMQKDNPKSIKAQCSLGVPLSLSSVDRHSQPKSHVGAPGMHRVNFHHAKLNGCLEDRRFTGDALFT